MNYKYKVYAASKLGDVDTNPNEYYYADGLSSVENGMCSSWSYINRECLGRTLIFAIASEPNNVSRICDDFSDSLSKSDSGNQRIKIQYELKSMMTDIREGQCDGNEESDLSVLYIEGSNVYAAGFGDVNIYRYDKERKSVEKVVFPSSGISAESDDNSDENQTPKNIYPRSKLVSPLKNGDKYLILSTGFARLFDDNNIAEALSSEQNDTVTYLFEQLPDDVEASNYSAVCFKVVKSSKKLFFAIASAVLALIIALAAIISLPKLISIFNKQDKQNIDRSVTSSVNDDVIADNRIAVNTSPVVDKSAIYQIPFDTLTAQLDSIASRITGDNRKVSYYVKNLISGDVIQNNSDAMLSASMNNIFVMAEVYRRASEGTLIIDDAIYSDLSSMITLGDNDAANRLITAVGDGDISVGFQRVTEFAQSIGCTSTTHSSDLQIQSVDNVVQGNYTSVADCGIILEKIYRGELVSEESSRQMLELLKNQHRRNKIPAYLPDNCVVANKTGETDCVQNDCAIVYSAKSDYIICVMINNYSNTMDDAIDVVARMSELTHNFINS